MIVLCDSVTIFAYASRRQSRHRMIYSSLAERALTQSGLGLQRAQLGRFLSSLAIQSSQTSCRITQPYSACNYQKSILHSESLLTFLSSRALC